ncbi:leucine-rich repeat domain-containing protein [Jejudonia soesokkakensis]|uniref:Leucine-rich repeat domain-containing protein n=1 Tax=Jejudonia soesokkakensis TaxID=1323432 RepID=A0ABW2MUA9_9FLAO
MKKILLTPVLLLVTLSLFAEVSNSEKQALVDLYIATNGENWTNTWDLNEAVSTWHGVTVTNDKVTGISLLFNNMHGELPVSLGSLTHLTKLELSFNQLSGQIPASLGNITGLKILAFNGNNLEGFIPESLGNIATLEELHLSSNQLTGVIPQTIGNLTNLTVLNVFDNNLKGAIPANLVFNQNLKQLIIAENNIEQSDAFAGILLFEGSKNPQFKKPVITPVSKTVIAIETNDDEN